MKTNLRLAGLALTIMGLFWLADSMVDLVFNPAYSPGTALLRPGSHEIYMRLITGLALALSTVVLLVTRNRNRQAQAELSQQKTLYQTLVESNPDFIIVHHDLKVLFANRNALNYFGLERQAKHVGTSILDFILPEFHDQVRQDIVRVMTESSVAGLELKLRDPDGNIRDIESFSSRVNWAGQISVFTYFRDITEAQQNRRHLVASRERLQLALDAARDGVWDWDVRNGEMVYSESWAAMLGFNLDEVNGDLDTWRRLIHPDDYQRAQDLIDSHLAGKIPGYELEVRLRHKDGHYLWVLDRGRVVERDNEGNALRMTGTHRDITARKEAEIALEIRNQVAEAFLTGQDENLFGQILAAVCQTMQAPVGMFLTLNTHNTLIAKATKPKKLLNKPTLQSAPLFDRRNLPDLFARVIEDNQFLINNEPQTLPEQGTEIQSVLGVPISSREQVLGAIYVADKAGGFRQADRLFLESLAGYIAPILQSYLNSEAKETQLRQAQKMEALGALAGGIAHDFNNILQAIMGFSTLALEETDARGNIAQDLERVLKATRRGQELVKRILLFSRRDEYRHAPILLQTVVSEAINLLKPSIPATIEIRSRLNAESAQVFGDPSQVSQIMLNLATNAYHAMEPGPGILEIDLRTTQTAARDLDLPEDMWGRDILVLTVSDTGDGMSPQTLSRIFDPFFTTKEVGQGTGLGMSVVHGIVKGHGGDIRIDSEVGIGTTVTVFFPIFTEPSVPLHSGAEDEAMALGADCGHIVLVDDEEDITDLGKALLEKSGHRVTAERNGLSLLARLEAEPDFCDLVITDLTMPQITGLQLAERIEKIRPGLPVLLITGMSEQMTIGLENHPNIFGLIAKPFSGETLRRKVEKALTDSGARGET